VLLKWKNSTLTQRIWIRQGEGADYLFGPADAINVTGTGGFTSATRPAAAKFVPYNLTTTNALMNGPIAVNGGIFTDYPSQAGALFQWASATNTRYAYDNITDATPAGWDNVSVDDYWDKLAVSSETCPAGYRRPNDGPTDSPSYGYIDGSEVRQSLWVAPPLPANTMNIVGNVARGFYADGFFDRRAIVVPPTSFTSEKTCVSTANNNIASIGDLRFNPSNNASIFFPVTGMRDYTDGSLSYMNSAIYYWTSSFYSTTSAHSVEFTGNISGAIMANINAGYGNPIRCVAQ